MGRVLLCVGSTAKNPYRMKKLSARVYTVEEVCYCIGENTFLVDDDIVCRDFIDWLGEECGLSELAGSLYGFLSTKGSVSAFVATILEYTGYYPKEDIMKIERYLKESDGLSEFEKCKARGDYLTETGKYGMAVLQYESIISDTAEADPGRCGSVYHNMGVAYAGLFSFEKAVICFEKAYELNGSDESHIQYLAAKRFFLKQEKYISFVADHADVCYEPSMELERRLEQSEEKWNSCACREELESLRSFREESGKQYYETLEETVCSLKERYRRMVEEN